MSNDFEYLEEESQEGWVDFYHDHQKTLLLDFIEHLDLTDSFKAYVKQQYKEALDIIETQNSLVSR